MVSWSASRKRAKVARRAAGSSPRTTAAISGTFGPETRTMPTPPRPGGVAVATIVSTLPMRAYLRLCARHVRPRREALHLTRAILRTWLRLNRQRSAAAGPDGKRAKASGPGVGACKKPAPKPTSVFTLGGLCCNAAVDIPLLRDGQDRVRHPVEH